MTTPRKSPKRLRICVAQTACEGASVSGSSEYVDCHKCRTKAAEKIKPPKPLRGQHCIDTYQRRL